MFIDKLKQIFIKHQPINVDDFLIIGHRGSPNVMVENTIESFDYAIKQGANAIELDVCLTKDQNVIAWHDWNPNDVVALTRQLGLESSRYIPYYPDVESDDRKRTSLKTLDEIRRHFGYKDRKGNKKDAFIPVLADVFSWANKQEGLKCIFLDIKIPSDEKHHAQLMMKKINHLIDIYQPKYKIVVMSCDIDILLEMKKVAKNVEFTLDIILPLGVIFDTNKYSAVKKAKEYGFSYASVGRAVVGQLYPWKTYMSIINKDVIDKNHIKLISWTIKDISEMKELIKSGVNGIMVDDPNILKSIVDKFK